ncbi:MAG TPA: hypothetical protein VLL48_03875, partial [Longimicrobiales bacterium]|nr:hypothetical protein [Longimicrobiales bacterium]
TVERYTFNEDLPPGFFGGREVVLAAGPEALADYEFEEGLFHGMDDVDLAPGTDPGTLEAVDVEAIAGSIIRQRYLRGISRFRAFASSGSDIVRYDRAQGLVLGVGASVGIGGGELYGHGGYAWGPATPVATLGWQPAGRPRGITGFGRAYLNDPVDLGLRPAAAGGIATLSAVVLGRDLRDVAPTTGVELGLVLGGGRADRVEASLLLERRSGWDRQVRHAPFDEGTMFRSVPPLEEVGRGALRLRYGRRGYLGPFATRWEPEIEAGTVFRWTESGSGPPQVVGPWTALSRETGAFARARIHGTATWSDARRRTGVAFRATVGLNVGATPYQHLWYLGGRNTLPGHPLHGYAGDQAAVADVTLWRTVVPRLVRLRAFAGVGWAEMDTDPPTPTDPALRTWAPGPSDGLRSSVGLGLGLIDGILHLDYGLRTDTWDGVLFLSVEPSLWSFL